MQHPYVALRPSLMRTLTTMAVTDPRGTDESARKLIGLAHRYETGLAKFGIPIVWSACTFERESSSDFSRYFGNGDPLDRPTRDVPRGRGPFVGPHAFELGYEDAILVDRLNAFGHWNEWPGLCYAWQLWHGFGMPDRGLHDGYLWKFTNVYTGGGFPADGHFSRDYRDKQMGCVAVARRMVELEPGLAIGTPFPRGATVPSPPPSPARPPEGVDGGRRGVGWLQQSLNRAGHQPPIDVDGSYGKQTVRAVRWFQETHGLIPDGLAGEKTIAAVERELGLGPATKGETP